MRSVKMLSVVVWVLFCVSSAKASWLSENFDLGDINGGYTTSEDGGYTNMYAHLGSTNKITGAGISMYPQYQYTYDSDWNIVSRTFNGYQIQAYLSGEIVPLTAADVCSKYQSNLFNARGIYISESSYIQIYETPQFLSGQLFSSAGAQVSISNFLVTSANGNYSESNGGLGVMTEAGGPSASTYFNYSVTWTGDFIPGTVPVGTTPSVSSSVPEPGTIAFLATGSIFGVGVFLRRRWRS